MPLSRRYFRPARLLPALTLLTAFPALAETDTTTSTDELQAQTLDAVKVTSPILSSQAQSIELQREAVNVVSAIAADDIGQLPDQTAAAALARLPAVAVQRDQGQERFIQIRGAPARWTSVAFDGINVIGAEDRIFRFDAVPAGLIDTVAVNKTLTPAMPAESLAGRVNIGTVSPMAQRGWHGLLEAGTGLMQLGHGDQRQGSARLAWSNTTFGVLLGGSMYKREQITDNREFRHNANGLRQFDLRSYHVTRETNSGMFKLEWRPTAGHALTLTSLYTEFKDHELRDQYIFDVRAALSGGPVGDTGALVGVPYNSVLQDGNYDNSTFTNTLAGQHALGNWELSWALNRSLTSSSSSIPLVSQLQTSPERFLSMDYDHRNRGLPTFTLYRTVPDGMGGWMRGDKINALNQRDFDATALSPVDQSTDTRSTTVYVSATRALDFMDGAHLSLGAQSDRRRADGINSAGIAIEASALAAANGLSYDLSGYVSDRQWHTKFPRGFDVFYVDNAAIRRDTLRLLDELQALGLYDPTVKDSRRYFVHEDLTAAWAMLEFASGAHQFLGGVRLEHTRIASHGFLSVLDVDTALSRSRSHTAFFPSLHWNLELSDTLKLRAAAITGLSRPSFGQLRVNAYVDDVQQTVGGGNPDLDPERAIGMDGSLEWYFAEAALASAGVFYRKVKDVLFDSTNVVRDARFDSGGTSRLGYEYNTTLNGGGGAIYGAEFNLQTPLSFLPPSLDGFGVQWNLALVHSHFSTPEGRRVAFPGTSKAMFNTSVYWEKHGLSARVSWQWRARWLDRVADSSANDMWWRATRQLDLSLRYAVGENITLFMDANNLTDETGLRYVGTRDRPYELEQFGRRYMAGVRWRF